MDLRLISADARSIESDVQLVKHFDGFIGGSEASLNRALSGALHPVFDELERESPPTGRLVRTESRRIKSGRLLLLGLGELDTFGLEDLAGAVEFAVRLTMQHGFASIATPVIGISGAVGLPIGRGYRVLLSTFLSIVAEETVRQGRCPIDSLTIFDADPEKVAFFADATVAILNELGIEARALDSHHYELDIGLAPDRGSGSEPIASVEATEPSGVAARVPIQNSTTRMLFLAAQPTDTNPLRLDEEIREIDAAIRRADYRDSLDIRQHVAVRVIDLQEHLLRHRPQIVHFSGHGGRDSSIVLEDVNGRSTSVPPSALTKLFSVFSNEVRCVVLNACFSAEQAAGIAQSIDCVVGMSSAVNDRAAIGFAKSFYQALAYGRSVKEAFELGAVEIGLEGLDNDDCPCLLVRDGVDAATVRFV